jgi:hypothetical protein
VPGSSSLDVDVSIAKSATGAGQKHRFRFGQLGLQETGKQTTRKSSTRKVSSVSQDSLLSKSPITRNTTATENPGGTEKPGFSSLKTSIATDKFIPSLPVDMLYSSDLRNESNPTSSQSSTTSQCCTAPRRGSDHSESSQLVCRTKSGHDHAHVQKLHLATTGAGNLDPFNTIPILDSSGRTQTLMHHCKHSISLTRDTPVLVSNNMPQQH